MSVVDGRERKVSGGGEWLARSRQSGDGREEHRFRGLHGFFGGRVRGGSPPAVGHAQAGKSLALFGGFKPPYGTKIERPTVAAATVAPGC
jgi:hypothetical protein